MQHKPCIGISMRLIRHKTFKNTFIQSIPQDYVNAVVAAGATPVLLPVLEWTQVLEEMLERLHGIIISGSDSYISPNLWGAGQDETIAICPQSRIETEFDIRLLRYSWTNGLPVLGICQGHQLINITLGGTLQAVETLAAPENSTPAENSNALEQAYEAPVIGHDVRLLAGQQKNAAQGKLPARALGHKILVSADSQLAKILQADDPPLNIEDPAIVASSPNKTGAARTRRSKQTDLNRRLRGAPAKLCIEVNSFHGFSIEKLAPCLEATAHAEDGTIEAVEWRQDLRQQHPFLLGVQWHPEMLISGKEAAPNLGNKDILMQNIFSRLVDEAKLFQHRDSYPRKLSFNIAPKSDKTALSFLPYEAPYAN